MVLFKRKPMQLLSQPTNIPDQAEIFVMRGTNEIFTDYEKYVQRLDFLMQKKFVDAVNGKSGLTFFAALQSETKSSTAIENVFPEVLRDPILRSVQFSTKARMDDLVNDVYEAFRRDFFPGELVTCMLEENEQITGIIREKAQFPMIRGPGGEVQRAAFSRYFVRIHIDSGAEGLFDDHMLRRDRRVFTKMNLRAFLKHSLQREAWSGAPWLVKEALAIQYRLPMEIPSHLLQDAKLLMSKQSLQTTQMARRRPKKMAPEDVKRMKQEEMVRMQQQMPQQPGPPLPKQPPNPSAPLVPAPVPRVEQKPPPPPVIKYPIEDLDLTPKRNGVKRPKLRDFTADEPYSDISRDSMGMLLEVWNTLNVQCEVYVLDSFTFDDFVDALNYHSTDVPCELLEEVHCAVLKVIVDDQSQLALTKGALPEMVEESSDESDAQDESELSLADVPARSTRSRVSQISAAAITVVEKVHRAQEMLGERDWISRCGDRDFPDGGWQVVLVGLLYNLSLSPPFKERCEEVLAELAPVDEEPTRETARLRYAEMDINLRISALQMITLLSIATPVVKTFLESCSDDMTDVRKRKIELQKVKKQTMEDLVVKDRDRKLLLPENQPPEGSPKPVGNVSAVASPNGDLTEDSIEVGGLVSSDPDDEAPSNGRSLRRGQDRKRKREEEAARLAEEKARKAEAAKKENKQSRELRKMLHEIDDLKKQILDCESKITECDADLREANIQRTRVLGKDRFCNRYYWFERNGQPFGGLPSSSTAAYGYANARIWVQGPDAMEIDGFVGSKEDQAEYGRRFGLTILERRRLEEGDTILADARDWGYYDDPHVLDNLIHWLDDRGEREKPLRKELVAWRDTIVQYMEARRKFVEEEDARRNGTHDDEDHSTAHSRISTRRQEREEHFAARERCLKWTNGFAMNDLGHLHSVGKARSKQRWRSGGGSAAQQQQPRQTRGVAVPVNRFGKPLTRQGVGMK